MHVPWHDSQSESAQVACVETPHLGFSPNYYIDLHTVDITYTWYYLESDNSDNYHVYIHRNQSMNQEGFYILKNYRFPREMAVLECLCHPMAPIRVLATTQLHITFSKRFTTVGCIKQEAKRVYHFI